MLAPHLVDYGFVRYLMRNDWKVIEVPVEEYWGLAVNAVTLEPGKVVMNAGSPTVVDRARGAGIEVIQIDFSESHNFAIAGLHCATLELHARPVERASDMASPTSIRPPFTAETAAAKVRAAQDAWNTRDPERVALAYTEDSEWRNRDEFFQGREEIKGFLRRKWARDSNRLRKLCGPTRTTGSPCASSTRAATPTASGGAPSAMRCGSSRPNV